MQRYLSTLLKFVLAWVIMACLVSVGRAGEPAPTAITGDESIRLGERIYREGILPSGKPARAIVKGDIEVDGTMFTCVSCHMRAGLGSIEGRVFTPPTTGKKLFQPMKAMHRGIERESEPPRRPAYTDASLAEVLRFGDDPAGTMMSDVMPRYDLKDADMAHLISYLKTLSNKLSPGVTEDTLRFATVVTDDVPVADREQLLRPLEDYVKMKNAQVGYFGTKVGGRSLIMATTMLNSRELALRKLSLTHWELHGPPESWKRQLEEYYRKEPVFALLGGLSGGSWKPIHDFCEEFRLPCLFPGTDYPVISKTDWYTLYLSKGYYLEGEGAARYLSRREDLPKDRPVLQLVRQTPAAEALAQGFVRTREELGGAAPVTVRLKPNDKLTPELLGALLERHRPAVLLLWDESEAFKALNGLLTRKERPAAVILSSSTVGKELWSLKPELRDLVLFTYPNRLPEDKITPSSMGAPVPTGKVSKIENQLFSITKVLNMALMAMRGNYYRDYFLDVIGMGMDQEVPLYVRLSFGPGQRYASKGCYLVQLSQGEKPVLVKKSEWVIH